MQPSNDSTAIKGTRILLGAYTTALCLMTIVGCDNSGTDSNVDVPAVQENRQKLSARNEYIAYRSVAIEGDPRAQLAAFEVVYENLNELDGEIPEALNFLRKSAESGNAIAQFNLGFLSSTGELLQQNEQEAVDWLEKASEAGVNRANLWLGITYFDLYKKVSSGEPDELQALFVNVERSLRDAIENPDDSKFIALAAQETLGRAYLRRSILSEDGWSLLMRSADSGHEPALDTLRRMNAVLKDAFAEGLDDAGPIVNLVDEYLDNSASVEQP